MEGGLCSGEIHALAGLDASAGAFRSGLGTRNVYLLCAFHGIGQYGGLPGGNLHEATAASHSRFAAIRLNNAKLAGN